MEERCKTYLLAFALVAVVALCIIVACSRRETYKGWRNPPHSGYECGDGCAELIKYLFDQVEGIELGTVPAGRAKGLQRDRDGEDVNVDASQVLVYGDQMHIRSAYEGTRKYMQNHDDKNVVLGQHRECNGLELNWWLEPVTPSSGGYPWTSLETGQCASVPSTAFPQCGSTDP